jgi:hypothetical protein
MDQAKAESVFSEAMAHLKHQKMLQIPIEPREQKGSLPAFLPLQAALSARVRSWKALYFASVLVLLAVIVGQQCIIFHKLFQKLNEQFVIVPGSPEFFRVRPGQVPDESVFLFAEYVAANIGTFTHQNVKYHFGKASQHMSPETKGRFETAFQGKLKDWEERKVDQVFAYEPVRKFSLVNDKFGPKYTTAVTGQRTQYVEGHVFSETQDVLLLEFRSRGNLTPDRPFIFELEKMEWLSPSQYQAILAQQKDLVKPQETKK